MVRKLYIYKINKFFFIILIGFLPIVLWNLIEMHIPFFINENLNAVVIFNSTMTFLCVLTHLLYKNISKINPPKDDFLYIALLIPLIYHASLAVLDFILAFLKINETSYTSIIINLLPPVTIFYFLFRRKKEKRLIDHKRKIPIVIFYTMILLISVINIITLVFSPESYQHIIPDPIYIISYLLKQIVIIITKAKAGGYHLNSNIFVDIDYFFDFIAPFWLLFFFTYSASFPASRKPKQAH